MDQDQESRKLKKDIRLYQLFSLGFGTIIGVGWLIVAGNWVLTAGPLGAILAFIIGGCAVAVVSLSYAEMGSRFPHSGGEVVYTFEAFGTAPAFVIGWLLVLFYVSICAFEAISTAWIISVLVPGLEGPVIYSAFGEDVTLSALIIGCSGMVFLTWLNYRGGGSAASFQDVVTIGFALISLAFVVGGIWGGSSDNAQPLFVLDEYGSAWAGFLAILATIPVWYSGFNTLPQALGEVSDLSNPNLLNRVLLLTLVAAALFYTGVILATSFAAPREVIAGADLPVAAALFTAFENPLFGQFVLVAGLMGIITSWNAMFFSGARALFAMSRGGMIPRKISEVHGKHGSPHIAVLFVGIFGAIGIFAGREAVLPIINLIGICLSSAYAMVCLSVLRLRNKTSDTAVFYKVPWYPWLPALGFVFAVTFLVLAVVTIIRDAEDKFPLEFIALGSWAILGVLVWVMAGKMRNSLSHEERRALIHLR